MLFGHGAYMHNYLHWYNGHNDKYREDESNYYHKQWHIIVIHVRHPQRSLYNVVTTVCMIV